MPIFEYSCQQCDKQFEDLVLGVPESVCCPECGSTRTRKLMSRCRSKSGGSSDDALMGASQPSAASGCAGCAGGSCASCA